MSDDFVTTPLSRPVAVCGASELCAFCGRRTLARDGRLALLLMKLVAAGQSGPPPRARIRADAALLRGRASCVPPP